MDGSCESVFIRKFSITISFHFVVDHEYGTKYFLDEKKHLVFQSAIPHHFDAFISILFINWHKSFLFNDISSRKHERIESLKFPCTVFNPPDSWHKFKIRTQWYLNRYPKPLPIQSIIKLVKIIYFMKNICLLSNGLCFDLNFKKRSLWKRKKPKVMHSVNGMESSTYKRLIDSEPITSTKSKQKKKHGEWESNKLRKIGCIFKHKKKIFLCIQNRSEWVRL